ncbi:phosphoenolpyruvate carboxylase [Artemisia annua]|uniref:Phosphoenolpyruvate carboxylase n=1 Tax=Artemisia annua TaxID=35608 RepID=A0A2U1QEN8_ARTAN|nr:phosphoenolpyruvate carboxylase [Artemisia annua]
MTRLFSIKWYENRFDGKQKVMIRYSDSGKYAGRLSVAWQLYKAQEELITSLLLFSNLALTLQCFMDMVGLLVVEALAQKALRPWDIVSAMINSYVFGRIIFVVSCGWGKTTLGGAKCGRECPLDLKEVISSICFAAPRCAYLPELIIHARMWSQSSGNGIQLTSFQAKKDQEQVEQVVADLGMRFKDG